MALTFIYGNSGNGKSEYIYQKTAELAFQEPHQRFYVVVPEQFTMSTQKSLVQHSSTGVIMNIDVVSFERLAYRVFDELGIHQTIMEETGKSLVLRKIVEEKEQEFTVLKGNLKKMGYISEVKSMISELMQYDISPDALEDFLQKEKNDSSLAYKLRDILCIYRAFDEYLQEGYVTAEKVLEVLMECAWDSKLLRDAVFVFDGYTGFTPVQIKLLHQILSLARDVYVTVTMDGGEELYRETGIQNLFYMSHKMVNSLINAARETKVEIADPIFIPPGAQSRFAKNPVLGHLEQNLFRSSYGRYPGACQEHLQVYSISNPKGELAFAAAKICQLVREKGYRYRDFAIVSGNVEMYDKYADAIFSRYKIPYFMDVKQSVLYHPLTEFLRAVLEMLERNFSEESVFRYLRTGLCGFSMEEIDLLENYCLEKGIHGAAKWKKNFLRPFRQHGRIKSEEKKKQDELAGLNQLRQRFWEQIQGIYHVFSDTKATVKEQTTALYEFLCQLSVEEQMQKQQILFEQSGQEQLSDIYRQIYKIVMDLFDKLVELLGDEVLSLSEYSDILEAGFSSAKVGSIPQGNDCVIVGDIERTRLDGIKILFFLGVNDGVIPKGANAGSMLSQYDREVLEEHHMTLAPDAREQVFLQRFYLYWNLTKPSDGLYLTFARMDGEGKAIRPSYLIGVLQKLFVKLQIIDISADAPMPAVTIESGVDAYLQGLILARKGEVLPEWKALHKWFQKSTSWAPLMQQFFDVGFSSFENESLEADLAKILYGTILTSSVTRLELFAKCQFAHFLEFGLKLADRNVFTFENLDMGSMFHHILQGYCTRLEAAYDWKTISEEQQEALLKEAMEEAVLSMPNESLLESARSAYVLERIYNIMKRSVWALTEQIRRGDFCPAGYEVEFIQTSQLDVDTMMRTVGRVDRIDTYENDHQVFVKIVDYKSGNTKFQLLQLYYGLQLQLVVYLNAAMEKLQKEHPGKEIVPAGIFYYHLDDPMVETEGTPSEEEILTGILAKLKMNGLVSMESEAYGHLDHGLLESGKSEIYPISLNKDLSVSKRGTTAATTEQFQQLSSYVKSQIEKAAGSILEGKMNVEPYRLGDRTGCDYCPYRSVCGFDGRIPGYQYHAHASLKDEEIWMKI